jgi:RNA polymerase sigma factor (sigma-70 family)
VDRRGQKPRDRQPLTEEQQELAGQYLPLAKKLARQFSRAYGLDREEVRSVAFKALVESAGSYNPALSKVGTYFYRKITHRLCDWIREERRHGRVAQLSAIDDYEAAFASPDGSRAHELVEIRDSAATLLSRASRREQLVLRMSYLEDKTSRQIGESVGVVHSRIQAIKQEALMYLRTLAQAGRIL